MLKRVRENKKGFTLAELLIVVAIIGVLVAVSIPIFTAQLSKARLATNQANARAAKAAAVAAYLTDDTVRSVTYTTASGTDTPTSAAIASTLQLTDTIPSWTTGNTVTGTENLGNTVYTTWYVSVDASGKILGYYATIVNVINSFHLQNV